MTGAPRPAIDPDFAGARAALLRAAQEARDTARRFGTPLVFWENGRVVHIDPDDPDLAPLPASLEGLTSDTGHAHS
jgi:nucleotide-binding universal stress UspA family protein